MANSGLPTKALKFASQSPLVVATSGLSADMPRCWPNILRLAESCDVG